VIVRALCVVVVIVIINIGIIAVMRIGAVAQRHKQHDAPHNVTHLTALTIAFSQNIEGAT